MLSFFSEEKTFFFSELRKSLISNLKKSWLFSILTFSPKSWLFFPKSWLFSTKSWVFSQKKYFISGSLMVCGCMSASNMDSFICFHLDVIFKEKLYFETTELNHKQQHGPSAVQTFHQLNINPAEMTHFKNNWGLNIFRQQHQTKQELCLNPPSCSCLLFISHCRETHITFSERL